MSSSTGGGASSKLRMRRSCEGRSSRPYLQDTQRGGTGRRSGGRPWLTCRTASSWPRVVRTGRVRGEDPLVDVVDQRSLVVVVVHHLCEAALGQRGLERAVGLPVLGMAAEPVA